MAARWRLLCTLWRRLSERLVHPEYSRKIDGLEQAMTPAVFDALPRPVVRSRFAMNAGSSRRFGIYVDINYTAFVSRTEPVPPAQIAEQCICLGFKRAARVLARRYDAALQPLDLTSGQFSLLASIAGLEPAGIQTLGLRLEMDRTTVTAALKPLQRRGLVEVAVSAHDARGRDVCLTSDGRALFDRAVPLWKAQQQKLSGLLSPAALSQLTRRLSDLA
jgi:DNA-binding MarR family transcriptional regulator